MLICSLFAYFVFGIGVFLITSITINGKITLGDILMAPLGALGWPLILFIFVAFKADQIVIWRRKC